jgi:hypothetical protein
LTPDERRRDVCDRNAILLAERVVFVPSHAPPHGECRAILAYHVPRIPRQFNHQEWNSPFRSAERTTERDLQSVGDVAVAHRIPGKEYYFVADSGLEKHDLGGQHPDVVGRVSVTWLSRLPKT